MPDRVLFHPADVLTKKLEEADLLLRGKFRFAGVALDVIDGSVFDKPAPSEDWKRALHGFEWLPPLAGAGGEAARTLATNLISQWVRRNGRYTEPAWLPEILSERLLNIFAHGRFVLANSDVLWRSKLLVSLREQSRMLARMVGEAPEGLPRLKVAVVHVLSGACLNDSVKRLETGLAQLEAQLAEQILPDGGHRSRSPEALLQASRYLVMVVDALTATECAIPASIRSAHDRIAPMLRFLRHGDGGLAVFNGGSECHARTLEALLARDDAKGSPFQNAPHSGYQRIASGKSLVLLDCGRVPSMSFSNLAHAGCLAFELSAGPQRIVVNCGPGAASGVSWNGALRATAAHSTATLADTSMATVLQSGLARDMLGPRMLGGPVRIDLSREELPQGCRLVASHDGYREKFAIIHERSLCLSPRGNVLNGMDRLVPVSDRQNAKRIPFAVRFHIHPDVRISPSQGGGFILKLPNGDGWRFRCDGEAAIEESIYVGNENVRRTEQLVLAGTAKDTPVEVGWAFEQIGQV